MRERIVTGHEADIAAIEHDAKELPEGYLSGFGMRDDLERLRAMAPEERRAEATRICAGWEGLFRESGTFDPEEVLAKWDAAFARYPAPGA